MGREKKTGRKATVTGSVHGVSAVTERSWSERKVMTLDRPEHIALVRMMNDHLAEVRRDSAAKMSRSRLKANEIILD